jgi:two-component system phosphate regulon sensor histidine kinase PhoR
MGIDVRQSRLIRVWFARWRKRFARGLTLRLTIPFVLLVTIVLLLLGTFLGSRARDIYVDRLSDELRNQASIIADSVQRQVASSPDDASLRSLVQELSTRTGSRITLIDGNGVVVADSNADPSTMENHASRPEVIEALGAGLGDDERSSRTLDEGFLYIAVRVSPDSNMVVRLAVPLTDIDRTVDEMQRAIWIAAAIAIALTITIALVISDRIVSPLQDLRRQAAAIAKGDLGVRVDPASTSEIGDLGRAFNTMTRRLAESRKALDETRYRMEAILAGLSDGVVLTDQDGVVLRMNEAAEEMFQVAEHAAIGLPFVQACRDYEIDALLRSALDGESHRLAAVEHGLNRKTLLTTAQVISNESERLGLVVLRDVSELRRLETVRREFVANVSHELRTPLTSIRALVETLETGAIDDPGMANEFLGRIVGEVDRLTALVEDLLDLARLEAGRSPLRRSWADPAELVHRGADRLLPQIERAQLTLNVTSDPGLPRIEVDESRIEQVLLNLVHNAIKFTPPGGTISVHVSANADEIVVEVSDTGIGVSQDDLARLFERFYKSDKARRSDGTGLGLAIAKHIIQSHGGDISVTSKVGKGATFRFTLPLNPIEPPKSWRLPSV